MESSHQQPSCEPECLNFYLSRIYAALALWASILAPVVLGFAIPFWGFVLAPLLLAVLYAYSATAIESCSCATAQFFRAKPVTRCALGVPWVAAVYLSFSVNITCRFRPQQ